MDSGRSDTPNSLPAPDEDEESGTLVGTERAGTSSPSFPDVVPSLLESMSPLPATASPPGPFSSLQSLPPVTSPDNDLLSNSSQSFVFSSPPSSLTDVPSAMLHWDPLPHSYPPISSNQQQSEVTDLLQNAALAPSTNRPFVSQANNWDWTNIRTDFSLHPTNNDLGIIADYQHQELEAYSRWLNRLSCISSDGVLRLFVFADEGRRQRTTGPVTLKAADGTMILALSARPPTGQYGVPSAEVQGVVVAGVNYIRLNIRDTAELLTTETLLHVRYRSSEAVVRVVPVLFGRDSLCVLSLSERSPTQWIPGLPFDEKPTLFVRRTESIQRGTYLDRVRSQMCDHSIVSTGEWIFCRDDGGETTPSAEGENDGHEFRRIANGCTPESDLIDEGEILNRIALPFPGTSNMVPTGNSLRSADIFCVRFNGEGCKVVGFHVFCEDSRSFFVSSIYRCRQKTGDELQGHHRRSAVGPVHWPYYALECGHWHYRDPQPSDRPRPVAFDKECRKRETVENQMSKHSRMWIEPLNGWFRAQMKVFCFMQGTAHLVSSTSPGFLAVSPSITSTQISLTSSGGTAADEVTKQLSALVLELNTESSPMSVNVLRLNGSPFLPPSAVVSGSRNEIQKNNSTVDDESVIHEELQKEDEQEDDDLFMGTNPRDPGIIIQLRVRGWEFLQQQCHGMWYGLISVEYADGSLEPVDNHLNFPAFGVFPLDSLLGHDTLRAKVFPAAGRKCIEDIAGTSSARLSILFTPFKEDLASASARLAHANVHHYWSKRVVFYAPGTLG